MLHSTSEARALGENPAPLSPRTSPPDTLRHSVITVPVPVPDTGVPLHVAPLDDDVTVADSVGVAAAAVLTEAMRAAPEISATTPMVASADLRPVLPTVQLLPGGHVKWPQVARRDYWVIRHQGEPGHYLRGGRETTCNVPGALEAPRICRAGPTGPRLHWAFMTPLPKTDAGWDYDMMERFRRGQGNVIELDQRD